MPPDLSDNFLVVDTEGKPELSEIAIVNHQGVLIYEAFNQDHPGDLPSPVLLKPLEQILADLQALCPGKILVFHYADHDLRVLKQSFKKAKLTWQPLEHHCTLELAKQYLPSTSSYSLEFLCKSLQLKADDRFFNPSFAHAASYDAQFTYQLYQYLRQRQAFMTSLTHQANPFQANRVDTPFQCHPDQTLVYQSQFESLKSALLAISQNPEHSSQGAIVLGGAGSGKTHLMMRLAQERLTTNRLLFIRQPNNPDSVFFHIYSRVLESFIETVPGSPYTQLEYLIAHSFVNILKQSHDQRPSPGLEKILEKIRQLEDNSLKLFQALQGNKSNWKTIERWILNWWSSTHSGAGPGLNILKGLIKFCSYVELQKRQLTTRWLAGNDIEAKDLESIGLESWSQQLGRESFALEALSVFGKLSILDQPLMIIFDQLEGLALDHNHNLLLSFGEAIKEIFTHVPNSLIILNLYPSRWQQYQQTFKAFFEGAVIGRFQLTLTLERPDSKQLEQILERKMAAFDLDLHQFFSPDQRDDILQQPSVRDVINRASDYYRHQVHGTPLPITPSCSSPFPASPTWGLPPKSALNNTILQRLETIEAQQNRLSQRLQQLEAQLTDSPKTLSPLVPESTIFDPNPISVAPAVPSNSAPSSQHSSIKPEIEAVLAYVKQREKFLDSVYDRPSIIDDSDDIGKVTEILASLKPSKLLQTRQLRLGKRRLPEHLVIGNQSGSLVIGFLHGEGTSFTSRLKNFNQLVINYKNLHFNLLRDARQPEITGKVGKTEIAKLNNAENGEFIVLQKANRLELELLYGLVVDIQNGDLAIEVETALSVFLEHRPQHWLTAKLLLTTINTKLTQLKLT
jgi:DNA polymerase III epsilon subunit-like protein